jgi:hypothetical protein
VWERSLLLQMVVLDLDKASELNKKLTFRKTIFAYSTCGIREFCMWDSGFLDTLQTVSLYDGCIEKLKYCPEQNHDLESEALRSPAYYKVRFFY